MAGKPAEVVTADLAESSAAQATSRNGRAGPAAGTDEKLAEVLADVMHVEQVLPDSNFFDDLGADSLVMAHFCARVRKQDGLPHVSMKDIYAHPTIASLAAAVTEAAPTASAGITPTAPADAAPAPAGSPAPAAGEVAAPASTRQYVLCGILQLASFLGYTYVVAVAAAKAYGWIPASSSLTALYLRSVVFGAALVITVGALPVVAKWILIGRWKPQEIRVWSLAYFRFWLVKTLIQRNPLALLAVGSPLYTLYLKALGAKVGAGVVIFSRHVPVCTDLLTIGGGTVIRKDAYFQCYRAQAGWIQTGAVTIGKDAFVGEMTVIDIGTSMGDGAQLGHSSSLHSGQAVPDGEHWHGSPARRAETSYRMAESARCGSLRRAVHTALQLLFLLGLYLPVALGGVDALLADSPKAEATLDPGTRIFLSWPHYREALIASAVLFFGAAIAGLLVVCTVPRVLGLAIKPGKVYPLYGFHHAVHRALRLMTNAKFFFTVFGDSSGILHYLRFLGYKLPQYKQTGSNFGTLLKHENPYLSSVGSGTMIADGLSIINTDFSNTSFRASRASIGQNNFLGNSVAYPSQGRTGGNCLLATKVLVPIDGEVREGIGLLGSPSFEIPRSVYRDGRFDHLKSGEEFRRRLAAKNRHNAVTVGMYLLARWFYFFVVLMIAWGTADAYGTVGAPLSALASVITLLFSAFYFVLFERAITVFLPLRPMYCSIYDRRFWRHERFWKGAAVMPLLQAFSGTPFKNLLWRLLGARVGKRLFDDGAGMPERKLVTVGDDVTFNAGSTLQCHSQEDGAFKLDRITIGSGCTVGIGALVHYGVTMGDGSVLAPDSFLMKGEEVPPHALWGGNPAGEIGEGRYQLGQRAQLDGMPRPAGLRRQRRRGRHRRRRRLAAPWRR